MSSILLVRHGQASFGAADYDVLSPTGHEQSRVLGSALAARGVTADDRIGLMLPDTPLHLLLHYALAWLGATIVPLDHRWTQVEAARMARAMKVKAVLGETDGELDGIRVMAAPGGWPAAGSAPLPVAAEGGERPLVLSLSSGTTGSPTGAIVPKTSQFAAIQNQEDAPPCTTCGSIMVRSGACYKCSNCGTTSGCA